MIDIPVTQKDTPVKNTVTAWLIVKGVWPARNDLHCELDRSKALDKLEVMLKTDTKLRLDKVHLILIKGLWHRVSVNPVLCEVPLKEMPAVNRLTAAARRVKAALEGGLE